MDSGFKKWCWLRGGIKAMNQKNCVIVSWVSQSWPPPETILIPYLNLRQRETLSEQKDKSYSCVYVAHTYRPGYECWGIIIIRILIGRKKRRSRRSVEPANAIIIRRHSDRDKSATWNVGPRNCVGPRVSRHKQTSLMETGPAATAQKRLADMSVIRYVPFFSLGRAGGSHLSLSLILG